MLELTEQQKAIVESKSKTILVNAYAGSGKTATLMLLAEKFNNGIYLAFNKSIVNEVVDKLPSDWQCKTFNSLGLSLVKKHYTDSKVNFYKYNDYSNKTIVDLVHKHISMAGTNTNSSWQSTCDHFHIDRNKIDLAKKVLKKGKADTSQISGEDMLQYPIDNGWKTKKFDIVLVDECQDLNPQQLAFLDCIPTKRIVFVGDANQAIYGFRGSDPYAIKNIISKYKPTEYDMTQSFRCPNEVINEISHIVPNVYSAKNGGSSSKIKPIAASYEDECFILSRTNHNLFRLAYKFIKNNDHFSIGTKFIKQLKTDLAKVCKNCKTLEDIRKNTIRDYDMALHKASENGWSTTNIENKYDGLLYIIDTAKEVKDIPRFLKSLILHSNSSSKRKLMTIHGAKGLESEIVYFIKPSQCDEYKKKAKSEWEKMQEDNLYYVACTRSLNHLVFVE